MLFGSILNTLESHVQNLVIHSTLKELRDYLHQLYSSSSNLNGAYDVTQELFKYKKGTKEFILFPITSDMKQMQD